MSNITGELENLNVFRHIDNMFTACHIVSAASSPSQRPSKTSMSNYEQCGCVGGWAKHGVCRQKALRKASQKQRTAVRRIEVAKGK